MITLAIMKQMEADGVAGLEIDKGFYWEEAPLQKDGNPAQGVWIVTRGGSSINTPHGKNQATTIDFFIAYNDKTKTEATAAAIAEWIRANLGICKLSGTAGSSQYAFENIRLRQTTTVANYGVTQNGIIVKAISAQVYYDTTNN